MSVARKVVSFAMTSLVSVESSGPPLASNLVLAVYLTDTTCWVFVEYIVPLLEIPRPADELPSQ